MGYFIRRGTEAAKGPYPASLLRQLAKSGRIKSTDEVMPEGATRWYRAWRITDFGLQRPEGVVARVGPGGTVEQAAIAASVLEPPPLLQASAPRTALPTAPPHGLEVPVVSTAAPSPDRAESILEDSSEGEPAVSGEVAAARPTSHDASPATRATPRPTPRQTPLPTPRATPERQNVPFRLVGDGPDAAGDLEPECVGATHRRSTPRTRSESAATQPVGGTIDLLLKQTLDIQGLKTEPEPGEKLVGTIAQDPTDVLVCGWGAFLSKLRGAVVATNRRIFICRPRGTGMEYHALELDAVARISLEQRLVWRRLLTVIVLVGAAIGLGAWAALARTPLNFAMAAEGATAFGIAAALSIVACIMAGRMRHPALVVRCAEGAARETFDLPCQRADRHVVMRMAALVRRVEPREASESRNGAGDSDAALVERTEVDSRGRRRSVVEPRGATAANDPAQWGDVGEVMPLEDYLKNRAAG